MLTALRKIQPDVDKELALRSAAHGRDPEHGRWQALAEIARDLASRRGTGLPRYGRQRLHDRTRGFEALFVLGSANSHHQFGSTITPQPRWNGSWGSTKRVAAAQTASRHG